MISKIRHKIKNISDIKRGLAEVWPQIKKETLLKLNVSMPTRLNTVIKNLAGATKY